MKVSIAMATYNGGQYLKAQLESFAGQTRQPDELIITDDCSADDTETIVRDFAKTVPFRVAFYRNENNLGYCGNFNAALMKTSGNLVFLSDQDDTWFPEKIEHMLGVAGRNPEALVVMNDAALTDGELNEVGLTKAGQVLSAGLTLDSFVMGCCCAVRRELLDFCLPIPDGYLAHDRWLVNIADGLNAKVVDRRVLQYYRRHESNESQYIANRTTRVTRTTALQSSLKKIFNHEKQAAEARELSQYRVFLKGLAEAIPKAPETYRTGLQKLKETTENRYAWLQMRFDMRQRPFIPRIFSVVRHMAEGGYSTRRGARAFIRDLLGNV